MDSTLSALNDFRQARVRADLQSVLARLTGESTELLSYDEVRQRLRGVESAVQHLEEIPLESIIGSVGRYSDFNRSFLPLKNSGRDRWIGVKRAMTGLSGVPPIEVYRIGDAYFVKDGNHRVSVARQQGSKYIEAYVTEVQTTVSLGRDIQPDELILKEEFADFLGQTQLHKLRPEADIKETLRVTVPGQYEKLFEHIQIHRYYMGLDKKRDISFEEAVGNWYDDIFGPVAELIEERGLLQDFPERTSADLYLWLAEYQKELEGQFGWTLTPTAVAAGVSEQRNPTIRQDRAKALDPATYFPDEIMVPLSGSRASWNALEQALVIAKREQVRIFGLHIAATAERAQSSHVELLRQTFAERSSAANVDAQLAVEIGEVVPLIAERSQWVDVVIANLSYPPEEPSLELRKGLGSRFGLNLGFQTLLRKVPRPVLVVPETTSPITKALLAYDGSTRSHMALFAAAYLATRWQLPLGVVTVGEFGTVTQKTLEQAKTYLDNHNVTATYHLESGEVAATLLTTLEAQEADLLIVGGYTHGPVLEPLLGGVLDDLLRQSQTPMLVCQ